jgi:hypothetical protein
MRIAPGVDIWLMRPEIALGIQVTASVYESFGRDLVITSVYRSATGTLLHSRGLAADFRLPSDCPRLAGLPELLADELDQRVADALRLALGGGKPGGQWDVLLELSSAASAQWTGPHIHIEYDPMQHPEVKAGLGHTT